MAEIQKGVLGTLFGSLIAGVMMTSPAESRELFRPPLESPPQTAPASRDSENSKTSCGSPFRQMTKTQCDDFKKARQATPAAAPAASTASQAASTLWKPKF